jgi:gamma-butyrobetaine dioxygenase
MTADTAPSLASLTALFTGAAMGRPYGEAISIRDHMLQSAELAMAQGLGDALVAAALLHDIGWALGDPHEDVAADWLRPLFGAAVTDPIRLHVAAKRYLVARDPGYLAILSAESLRTLARQGGSMDSAECAAFAALPGHQDALRLRYIDDAAKRTEPPVMQFADFLPLLRGLM